MANLENQPNVQTFLESKNPSHEQIVKAYIARDTIFGHNLDENFNQAMIKLGLHPDYYEKEIDNRYRKVILNHVNQFLKDKSHKIEFPDYINDSYLFYDKSHKIEFPDYISFNENLVKEYEKRNERFNTLYLLKDNMKDVYDQLSKDELLYLGW